MNQALSLHLIELLDRKYDFVSNSPLESFMLDLKAFVHFIFEDEAIEDFTGKVLGGFQIMQDRYIEQLKAETKTAVEIKNDLIKLFPSLDDSNAERQGLDFRWEYTFAYFEKVLNESYRTGTPFESEPMDDKSDVKILIDILRSKVDQAKEQNDQTAKELSYRVTDLDELHTYTHREWVNGWRLSAGASLYNLIQVVNRINPEPKDQTAWRQMSDEERFNQAFNKAIQERGYEWITDATYGLISRYSNYSPANMTREQLQQKKDALLNDLRRAYESIRQEIGTAKLHSQLMDRYRIRCQWYNQQNLRRLILDDDGQFIRNREEALTRDLALFLYDEGVTVIYRPRFGAHEYDLLELDAKHPMFIEVKAYKDNSARSDLISGISQLHAYLSAYDAHKNIFDAYYVIYRVGGPIYDFPREIKANRFTIHTFLVDLGTSEESGRRQTQPVVFTKEEILETIES
jgi:hypothetical protein